MAKKSFFKLDKFDLFVIIISSFQGTKMIFYVQTGNISVALNATSHKQAAMRVVRKEKNLGKFVIVGLEEIKIENSSGSHMFFHTDSLIDEECSCSMKIVE